MTIKLPGEEEYDCEDEGGKRNGRGKGSPFEREMNEAARLAQGFGRAMTQAFTAAAVGGKKFDDVLKGLVLRLSSMAVKAALRPIEQGLSQFLEGLFGGLLGQSKGSPQTTPTVPGPTAPGDQFPPVTPFAKGGVIATPSYFRSGLRSALRARRVRKRSCRSHARRTAGSACARKNKQDHSQSRSMSRRRTLRASAAPRLISPARSHAPSRAASGVSDASLP